MRTLAARIYPIPLKLTDIQNLEKALVNCSLDKLGGLSQENTVKGKVLVVNEALLNSCTEVTKLLNESKGIKSKFKYEIVSDDDVAFKMISNNASMVLRQLDNIRALKKKFICLNDNIVHSKNATIVRALLIDFYESLFPIPSQFELPKNFRNTFLYTEDLTKWKDEQQMARERNCIFIGLIFICILIVMYCHKILRLVFDPFRHLLSNTKSEARLHTI